MEKNERELDIIINISNFIYNTLQKNLNKEGVKRITGIADSGDATFKIDSIVEEELYEYIKNRYPECSYFSEDKGLVAFEPEPQYFLIIDPIDGTRPILCNFETACISIALTDYTEVPLFGDIKVSIVKEIKTGTSFIGVGDQSFILSFLNQNIPVNINETSKLEGSFGSFDTAGTPFDLLGKSIRNITDAAAVSGGIFLFNSATYCLTRLLTGQLDFHIDVGGRIYNENKDIREEWLKAGNGRVVSLRAYDIAGSWHVLKGAGCCITDAYGNDYDKFKLMPDMDEKLLTCIAAVTEELYSEIYDKLLF